MKHPNEHQLIGTRLALGRTGVGFHIKVWGVVWISITCLMEVEKVTLTIVQWVQSLFVLAKKIPTTSSHLAVEGIVHVMSVVKLQPCQ